MMVTSNLINKVTNIDGKPILKRILKSTTHVTGKMGEDNTNPNTDQDGVESGVEPMNFAGKLKEGVKINFRRLESENQKESRKWGGTHQPAVISNRFEALKSDPGPSGTKTSEDDDIVEGSGAGKHEKDIAIKEGDPTRRDDSEGEALPVMVDKDPNDSGLRDKERACEVHSCMILMKGLEEFRVVSGLAASVEKSTVFFCQVPLAIKRAIMCVMSFEEGKLPIRYLGVPLISSNLVASNCKTLLDK
ncbi:hypothetical protein QVD17_07163 [Tagetes erecta]|uniref:Uncharacterized protein n=1 Tax=Tagetes erecta TaxID=13708 RepID=A0AAD8PCR9_TARER|nr:hypothetical protein QVD17_07163 [Tagetes erecta]